MVWAGYSVKEGFATHRLVSCVADIYEHRSHLSFKEAKTSWIMAHTNRRPSTDASLPPPCRYLEWDQYFMALAFLSAQRSKDPSKQVMGSSRRLADWDIVDCVVHGLCLWCFSNVQ
jgi:hypothetical protein